MTYDQAQVISQLVSMGIFITMLVAAFMYAFRSSNKKKFDHVAKSAIGLNDNIDKR